MPLPERYKEKVPEIVKVWESDGYFTAQMGIWGAESRARHELYGEPTAEELKQIDEVLVLTPDEVVELNNAPGHETNNLLRKVQSKLPAKVGNRLHDGNTSSDVLDTSVALQIRESIRIIELQHQELRQSLRDLALKHKDTLQIGRTHTQHAAPQTFGRQVLSWEEGVVRNMERLDRAREVISYGKLSGEVGTNIFIQPEVEMRALEILELKPDTAPTQVIGRDRHSEVVNQMAVNAGWLEKIATDIRLLASTDIREVREPWEPGQQGSSSMPHKNNTELTERICGLARHIRAVAGEEGENIALWLERDISHSSSERFTFPDAFGALSYATYLTKYVIENLEVFPERMRENLESTSGAIYSNRLLNEMMAKGVSRTEAYDLVQALAKQAMDNKTPMLDLVQTEPRITQHFNKTELTSFFDPEFYLRNIDVAFKRAGLINPSNGKQPLS